MTKSVNDFIFICKLKVTFGAYFGRSLFLLDSHLPATYEGPVTKHAGVQSSPMQNSHGEDGKETRSSGSGPGMTGLVHIIVPGQGTLRRHPDHPRPGGVCWVSWGAAGGQASALVCTRSNSRLELAEGSRMSQLSWGWTTKSQRLSQEI